MNRILTYILLLLAVHTARGGEITVRPGESLHDALRKAREWRRTKDARCDGGITITVKAGRYYMNEPLFLRPEDSGTAASPLVIRGEQGAVLCGDPRQQHTQVWPIIKQGDGLTQESMERLIDFDAEARTITIPTPPKKVLKTNGLEMVVHQRWAIAILRVKQIKVEGDHTVVTFQEPESRLEFEHPWPQPVISPSPNPSSSFLLRTTEQRYGIEQLMMIDGAKHVTFENITFENTCWNRPLHKGHVTLQGGFPLIDAYKLKEQEGLPWDSGLENQAWIERPVSAVTVRNTQDVHFTGCTFQHMGCTALDMESISVGSITGCHFEDIGGTAIMAGSFAESPREVHRPYQDLSDSCQQLTIKDNVIHDAANEDWGAVAISCGYVRDCTISHNDVSRVNYSGICVGWGWTPLYTGMENNHIIKNKVSDYARLLYDAGGIYTLSNQPHSSIRDNEISQPFPAPYATNDRAFCIYLDARTDGFIIENNRTGSRLIRRNEIGDNHPGPNNIFKQ